MRARVGGWGAASAVVALAIACAPAWSAGGSDAAPSFAGTWQLDLAASNLWPRKARRDTTRLDRIGVADGVLVWSWTSALAAPEDTGTVRIALDGRETSNRVRGRSTRNRARWDADTLAVETRGRSFGFGFHVADRLWVEDLGATLVMRRDARHALGGAAERWVFRRVMGSR